MNISEKYADIISCRKDFPSLHKVIHEHPVVYLDGPGGSQVPQPVIDAISDYYKNANANAHGWFETSVESDRIIHAARGHMATFLNAESPSCISFGANMTSLTFSLSKGIARMLQPGDEVVITQLDHQANRGPWLNLREHGIIVKEVQLLDNGMLNYNDFESKLSTRTRLIAMGMASNAIGTINDMKVARKLAYEVNAWLLVDAVHYAPHFPLDVQKLGVDFLLCSAYKFYGPHVGILYSKEGLLDQVPTDRLCTQSQHAPYSIETGTLNHAAIAGVKAAVEYIASFAKEGETLREKLVHSMNRIAEYEHVLAKILYEELILVPGLITYGPTFETKHRTPTISFAIEDIKPSYICQKLNEKGICAWDGHFYAVRPLEVLGLLEKGGLTRLGISIYNTEEEMNRTIDAIREIVM